MKKRSLAVLLALAMLIGCVALFASCGPKPELDLRAAEDALEDEDYFVYYSDDEDEEEPYIEESLYAYKDDESLTIVRFADSKSAKLFYNELKFEYDTEVEELELEIKRIKHILNKYSDELKSDYIDELEDELKDYEKELEELQEEGLFGINGKVVWYGTERAIEDSKG